MSSIESSLRLDTNRAREVSTPALLIDVGLVAANLDRMITVVGGPANVHRLRPHLKTHKSPMVTAMQVDRGIRDFKAATMAEAEMAGKARAAEVLIAHPPVGPRARQILELAERHPDTIFGTIVDDGDVVDGLKTCAREAGTSLDVFIDVDCGMHRTGIPFGEGLARLREQILSSDGLRYRGLHVYDGHVHDASMRQRQLQAEEILASVHDDLLQYPSPQIVIGGSPTFACYAGAVPDDDDRTRWQFSPGTTIFWDTGYDLLFAEMDYDIAACLMTRVVSRPAPDRLCLDLGIKAIAAEKPLALRFVLPAIPDSQPILHSEEHLVIRTNLAGDLPIGTPLVVLPDHICPSVAKYDHAHIVRGGEITEETWDVMPRSPFHGR